MTVLIEGRRPGGFIVWEAFRDYCRETVTLAAGTLEPGTVLGRVTASGHYVAHLADATDGSETAAAVLWGRADAADGPAPGVALLRGPAVLNRHLLVFAGTPEPAEIDAAHSALAELGLRVR